MTPTPASCLTVHPEQASAWAGQRDWRILSTRFGLGQHFLGTWQAWKNDPQRPERLHYVGLSTPPGSTSELLAFASACPEWQILASELGGQRRELHPGFHRFTLDQGHVLLTLCIGEMIPMLREQHFFPDEVFLDTPAPGAPVAATWSRWSAKALARCCRRGTWLKATGDVASVRADLAQCGFEFTACPADGSNADGGGLLYAQFNPGWTLRAHEAVSNADSGQPGTCAVVGAGLAGASVASALARRGWQVQVLDRAAEPTAGASGLPVGLVVPHVSVDDCALSRLSRAGVRLMLHEASCMLKEGEDWAPSGTLERCLDGGMEMKDIWHPQAAWLKPGPLVRAWLAQPGITFKGMAPVGSLRPMGAQWELLDDEDHVIACADRVVLANACGVASLLSKLDATHGHLAKSRHQLPALRGVRGQVSWAMHAQTPEAVFPPAPVNGAGSVIPRVPFSHSGRTGAAWFVGATYQPDDQSEYGNSQNHAANLARVQRLLPELGQQLREQFASNRVAAWKGTRCVTSDRLPMVGAVNDSGRPGLWICAGMGSRGLSFSVLCAELLAAQWGGEPWAIEARLARLLNALRSTNPASGPRDTA